MSSFGLDSNQWQSAVAAMIAAGDVAKLSDALADGLSVLVDHEGTCLIAFRHDSAPVVLHHTLEPAGRAHYLDRYLAGPYLLDPLYQLALQEKDQSLCRFRDALPDRFRSSEYYRQYCDKTHLLDEMDFFCNVSATTTLALVVGRRTQMFSKTELKRLEQTAPIVQACMRKIWLARGSDNETEQAAAVHQKLTECFDRFGETVLTDREREISQLLLRGHSSKSIARELNIAPGTVMVHKRNMFGKLGISSQYELFSLFIDDLGR